MAIYNVDAINESLESKKNDSLIDSLSEACDYMFESLLYIDEGARQKYVEILGKKQDNIKKEIEHKKENLSAVTPGSSAYKKVKEELDDLRGEYDSLADKASRYSAKVGTSTSMTKNSDGQYRDYNAGKHMNVNDRPYYVADGNDNNRRNEIKSNVYDGKYIHYDNKDPKTGKYIRTEEGDPDSYIDNKRNINKAIKDSKNDKDFKKSSADLGEYNRYNTRSYRQPMENHEKGAKRNFENDTGMSRQKEDKLAAKKPGSVLAAQEKKKAIKETCLYILSVIDDM